MLRDRDPRRPKPPSPKLHLDTITGRHYFIDPSTGESEWYDNQFEAPRDPIIQRNTPKLGQQLASISTTLNTLVSMIHDNREKLKNIEEKQKILEEKILTKEVCQEIVEDKFLSRGLTLKEKTALCVHFMKRLPNGLISGNCRRARCFHAHGYHELVDKYGKKIFPYLKEGEIPARHLVAKYEDFTWINESRARKRNYSNYESRTESRESSISSHRSASRDESRPAKRRRTLEEGEITLDRNPM